MTFSPSTNITSNFHPRRLALQELLVQEGLDKPAEYNGISRLFGYEMAVRESTFTEVVVECAALGRDDLVPSLLNFLCDFELGQVGYLLLQKNQLEALGHVLPKLANHQLLSFFSASVRNDASFDVCRPYISVGLTQTSLLLMTAATNGAPRYGAYFIENGDVLQALRDIKTPSVSNQIATWWVQAIEEQRVPVPDLGRSEKHWRKKFPMLGAVMRSDELEKSLHQPTSSTRKPRF